MCVRRVCVCECKLPLSRSLFICLGFHPVSALMQALPEIIAPRTGYTRPLLSLIPYAPVRPRLPSLALPPSSQLPASCLRHFSRHLSCTKCNTFDCTHAQVLWPKWLLLLLLLLSASKKKIKIKSRREKGKILDLNGCKSMAQNPSQLHLPFGCRGRRQVARPRFLVGVVSEYGRSCECMCIGLKMLQIDRSAGTLAAKTASNSQLQTICLLDRT